MALWLSQIIIHKHRRNQTWSRYRRSVCSVHRMWARLRSYSKLRAWGTNQAISNTGRHILPRIRQFRCVSLWLVKHSCSCNSQRDWLSWWCHLKDVLMTWCWALSRSMRKVDSHKHRWGSVRLSTRIGNPLKNYWLWRITTWTSTEILANCLKWGGIHQYQPAIRASIVIKQLVCR